MTNLNDCDKMNRRKAYGSLVKRLRHGPLKAETAVRFCHESPNKKHPNRGAFCLTSRVFIACVFGVFSPNTQFGKRPPVHPCGMKNRYIFLSCKTGGRYRHGDSRRPGVRLLCTPTGVLFASGFFLPGRLFQFLLPSFANVCMQKTRIC